MLFFKKNMINNLLSVIPIILASFFFAFSSKCMPTFFSLFFSSKKYNSTQILLISILFFLGSFFIKYKKNSVKKSIKIFHICTTILSIILLLQNYINQVWIWFFIRFIHGILEISCRNALYNITPYNRSYLFSFSMNFGSSCGFLIMCYQNTFDLLLTITCIFLSLSHLCFTLPIEEKEDIKIHMKKIIHVLDIFLHHRLLFFLLLISSLLVSTFYTLVPLMLLHNNFYKKQILRIMFFSSLGSTLLNLISNYIKKIIGLIKYTEYIIGFLFILYLMCIFIVKKYFFLSIFLSSIMFFIMGFHQSLHLIIIDLLKESIVLKTNSNNLEIRNTLNKINDFSSILGLFLSLFLIKISLPYGLFLLWFLSLIIIYILIKIIVIFNLKIKNL